ncbi:MAG: flavodoxin-dependent (E)-4-hydroxy-3-methylbut-2-enyl-diphosphate synthase [Kiritimatiellae bacterium]|nr:flavodoxin-dependent (E)-4-hydroxy-3-methylbut-2-enyl-diphosphate synthase [Kiritimatiellia bacterium]
MSARTRVFEIGGVPIGGGAPISVQTMANIDPHDGAALLAQINRCADVGCDIFRLTIPDMEAAQVLKNIRPQSPIPLVADIHFDYRLALAAIEAGVDKLRLNPGNIGSRDKVQAVVRRAKEKKVPIRIGVNLGSLEKDLALILASGPRSPARIADSLTASALRHLKILEDERFYDVVISAKASNVESTIATYRKLAEKTDCPLHVGVTEAGTFLPGTIRSSVALGILLEEGIGDTIRVSLTDQPEKEVRVGVEILRSLGLKPQGPTVTSCPTCGRTKVDIVKIAGIVESELEKRYSEFLRSGKKGAFPHVAVMGCAVNGPGEAKGADVALCGGAGEFIIYVKGEYACKASEKDAVGKAMEYVDSLR